jgi:16S rRNA (uracil1498-N3)-methyltransferase
MHHFFVDPDHIVGNNVIITGSDVNHIKNVLRMKENDEVLISDGNGKDYYCTLDSITNDKITARILDTEYEGCELTSKFYLFQGMPKADKMELIIQKAVELGVYEIIPVMTKRTVVKLEDKKKELKKVERWQSIAASAAKQSGRGFIPTVTETKSLKEALSYAKNIDCKLIPYENAEGMKKTKEIIGSINANHSVGIFIGPEGGFEESEIELASLSGFEPISLGRRILRTETAGLAILSMIMLQMEQ